MQTVVLVVSLPSCQLPMPRKAVLLPSTHAVHAVEPIEVEMCSVNSWAMTLAVMGSSKIPPPGAGPTSALVSSPTPNAYENETVVPKKCNPRSFTGRQ